MSDSDASSERTPHRIGYDDELQRLNEVLRVAAGVQFRDHVLDIGCGTGQTTREAARAATAGGALGIDVSASAIMRARELARAERLRNASFERADAQLHSFPQDHFDLAISRFGTMFFDAPVDAFANIRRALRPAGRLTMMVWRARELNEWDDTIQQALGADAQVAPDSGGPDPFSLGDPRTVKEILDMAGYTEVAFTDIDEPVYYGPDVAAALDWVRAFTSTVEVLERLTPSSAARAVERLRRALAAHMSDDGVWLSSRAWIVTARRP